MSQVLNVRNAKMVFFKDKKVPQYCTKSWYIVVETTIDSRGGAGVISSQVAEKSLFYDNKAHRGLFNAVFEELKKAAGEGDAWKAQRIEYDKRREGAWTSIPHLKVDGYWENYTVPQGEYIVYKNSKGKERIAYNLMCVCIGALPLFDDNGKITAHGYGEVASDTYGRMVASGLLTIRKENKSATVEAEDFDEPDNSQTTKTADPEGDD